MGLSITKRGASAIERPWTAVHQRSVSLSLSVKVEVFSVAATAKGEAAPPRPVPVGRSCAGPSPRNSFAVLLFVAALIAGVTGELRVRASFARRFETAVTGRMERP